MRKIAIVGSRDFGTVNHIAKGTTEALVDQLQPDDVVISGGAAGVDTWAADHARARGLAVEVFPADWRTHGRAAGPIRNGQIVAAADLVYAVWDGKSRGTQDTIRKAKAAGKWKATATVTPD